MLVSLEKLGKAGPQRRDVTKIDSNNTYIKLCLYFWLF